MRSVLSRAAILVLVVGSVASFAVTDRGADEVRTVHVRIHLSRFEPGAFVFAPGDRVRFVVHNADPIPHEFILGDRTVQLLHERGTEAYHQPRPGEMTIAPGDTMTTTYAFEEPGRLMLGCHLPGHYAYGMRAPVVVG